MPTDLVAASGRSVLAFAGDSYRLSSDFGATWKVVTPALSGSAGADRPDYVANGIATFRVGSGRGVVVDLGTGTSGDVDLGGVGEATVVALTDTRLLLRTGRGVVLSALDADLVAASPVLPAWADLPAAPGRTRTTADRWTLDGSFAYHLRTYTGRGSVPLATDVDPVGLDGRAVSTAFRVPGDVLFVHPLDAGHLEYAYRAATSVRRCVQDLGTATSTCRSIASTGRRARVRAERMGDVLVVTVGARVYTCADDASCRLGRVRLPKRLSVFSTSHPVGDPVEPVLSLGRKTAGPLYSVTASRRLVLRSAALTAAMVPAMLGLAADRVVGLDTRPAGAKWQAGYTAWQRPLSGSGIGAERVLGTGVTDIAASAARVATNGRAGLVLYDDGRASARARRPGTLGNLSGPYPLMSTSTATWVGAPLTSLKKLSGTVSDNFGTQLLSVAASGDTLVVTDLADPAYRREIPLPGRLAAGTRLVSAQLWGDWVGVTYSTATPADGALGVSLSARVARISPAPDWSDPVPGALTDLGDGLAVVCDLASAGHVVRAWNLSTGALSVLPGAARHSYPAVDSGRVAYATATELVVREIPGTGTSAPLALGTVAPSGCRASACRWSLQLDATKPLSAGVLLIRDATGARVRALRTPATADGSLRGLTWDGRRDDGSDVPAGTYAWELSAAASDGSGALRVVSENVAPHGTITVPAHRLGRAKLGAVKVSDRTPVVGQVLTVGARVRPADASLSYTWYAGSTVVAAGTGADAATYQVQPTDVGLRLRVVVVAQRDGYRPATRASARTRPVSGSV